MSLARHRRLNGVHGTIVFALPGPLARERTGDLCDELRRELEATGAAVAICAVGGLVEPTCASVDVLARLQLTARRLGCELRLGDAPPRLAELLELLGLAEVLGLEGEREPEQREHPLGVEEKRQPDDLVA